MSRYKFNIFHAQTIHKPHPQAHIAATAATLDWDCTTDILLYLVVSEWWWLYTHYLSLSLRHSLFPFLFNVFVFFSSPLLCFLFLFLFPFSVDRLHFFSRCFTLRICWLSSDFISKFSFLSVARWKSMCFYTPINGTCRCLQHFIQHTPNER